MNDLTEGKPWPLLRRFALPLLLSTALQQLYYIADSVILGQYTGSAGLASIGAAYPITLFFLAVATGSAMGISVVASQLFGAKQIRELKTSIYTALFSMLGLGLLLTILGVSLSGPLLRWLNAEGEVYSGGKAYLAIYSAGLQCRQRSLHRAGGFPQTAAVPPVFFDTECAAGSDCGRGAQMGDCRRCMGNNIFPTDGRAAGGFRFDQKNEGTAYG